MFENIPFLSVLIYLLFSLGIIFKELIYWGGFNEINGRIDPLVDFDKLKFLHKIIINIHYIFEISTQVAFLILFSTFSLWLSFLLTVITLFYRKILAESIVGLIEGLKDEAPKKYSVYLIQILRLSHLASFFLAWRMFRSLISFYN